MCEWTRFTPRSVRLRVHATSCCGAYELASEGGQYFVLRPDGAGGQEETGRGLYAYAARVWADLAANHQRSWKAEL
ncbi:hypothetical protein FH608_048295 [Nonomuraea phyllanthi]|uniref:Uncharacterized protein n=1 Tax=Nonomuraea phyllanthi TaxID=2219224 RepID=A0A5C4UZW7_9ACTN|nr:hypothetical protein [Nonomuraea phyllanthi]KAB8184296.1 hypothetical protein FH608_048295 [Nonomuraea phyllanthi]QFY12550.1 hypothetical protein GBF35_43595 [Nonomuraea phyllanthi]